MSASATNLNQGANSRAALIAAAKLFADPEQNKKRIDKVVSELIQENIPYERCSEDAKTVRDGCRVISTRPEQFKKLLHSPVFKPVQREDLKITDGDLGVITTAGKNTEALSKQATDPKAGSFFDRVSNQFLDFVERMQPDKPSQAK